MPQLIATPTIDSIMNFKAPDTNYGANGTINCGAYIAGADKDQLNRAIANFDVSAIPGNAQNLTAKMLRTITLADPSPHSCEIVRCKKPTLWTENGVTWNKYDGVTAWASGGADPNDTDDTTPPALSYAEAVAGGDFYVHGLAGFVRDALDNRAGIVSIVQKAIDEAPIVSQRSIWLAQNFWKLIIDYDVPTVGGRRSQPPSGPGHPARPPHRAASPHKGAAPRTPTKGRTP